MKKSIVLIGMPGCGKSTIGKIIAKDLNYDFCDMDEYIEEISGKKIPELFQEGESIFRDWETKACKELANKENFVIASGGGVVKRNVNMEILKGKCIIVFIDRPTEDIIKDVNVSTRPLLKDGVSKIYDLYNERYELYKKVADVTVVNKGLIEEVIESCEKVVRKFFC
ncbi:MAG: shikimate kinase [Clostridium sp.]|nr:shikimate kinase [Clostridium sp.]